MPGTQKKNILSINVIRVCNYLTQRQYESEKVEDSLEN